MQAARHDNDDDYKQNNPQVLILKMDMGYIVMADYHQGRYKICSVDY